MKRERKTTVTIYHLHLKDESLQRKDYYFGSISAIYEVFPKKQIGIQASSLYNYKLDENTNPIYENAKCIIQKNVLISKSQSVK
jgi:hypothetical protein